MKSTNAAEPLSKSVNQVPPSTGPVRTPNNTSPRPSSAKAMLTLPGQSAGFMSLALIEAKDELRLSKKSEQMAREQLAETSKRLEQVEDAYAKYRLDAEARIDTLRTENSMVTVRL